MPKQKVGSGESTSSLAKKNGFNWKTIWEHGENTGLRGKRDDPNVLHEEDEIFIPEKQLKEVSKGTESKHTFKRKGEPCKIKIQLLKLGNPRANEDYVIDVGGTLIKGKTDGNGNLEHFIPGESSTAKLILRGGKEEYPLNIGNLDPFEKLSGIQQRLNNLGFSAGSEGGDINETVEAALKKFQAEHKLDITGKVCSATKAKLKELSK
jgi:hypothetical protein